MIGTRASLGVGPSTEVLLYVICSPVAKYYSSGAKPISLLCNSKEKIRAWPGGTGDCKFGSNYGPCVEKQIKAAQKGYQQVLWVFEREDDEALITEVGMMNAFFAFQMQDGGESRVSNGKSLRMLTDFFDFDDSQLLNWSLHHSRVSSFPVSLGIRSSPSHVNTNPVSSSSQTSNRLD